MHTNYTWHSSHESSSAANICYFSLCFMHTLEAKACFQDVPWNTCAYFTFDRILQWSSSSSIRVQCFSLRPCDQIQSSHSNSSNLHSLLWPRFNTSNSIMVLLHLKLIVTVVEQWFRDLNWKCMGKIGLWGTISSFLGLCFHHFQYANKEEKGLSCAVASCVW